MEEFAQKAAGQTSIHMDVGNKSLAVIKGEYARDDDIATIWQAHFPNTTPEQFLSCFNFGEQYKVEVRVEASKHKCNFDVTLKENGVKILHTKPRLYDREFGVIFNPGFGNIYLEAVEVENAADRLNKALGKQYAAAIVTLALMTGVPRVDMRAGWGNGRVFWSRMGLSLNDEHAHEKFSKDVKQYLGEDGAVLPADLKARIEGVLLNEDGSKNLMANVEIAYMDKGQEAYRDMIFNLFDAYDHDMPIGLDTRNETQMALLRDALGRSGIVIPNRPVATPPQQNMGG